MLTYYRRSYQPTLQLFRSIIFKPWYQSSRAGNSSSVGCTSILFLNYIRAYCSLTNNNIYSLKRNSEKTQQSRYSLLKRHVVWSHKSNLETLLKISEIYWEQSIKADIQNSHEQQGNICTLYLQIHSGMVFISDQYYSKNVNKRKNQQIMVIKLPSC